ncbi:MAG: biotin/lipoyl-binding protein [Chloroflexi bacterium]|nr:biotin/lipoyl-binding protein [Chloroflexota bacterium]
MKHLKIVWKVTLGLVILGTVGALLAGCSGKAGATTVSNQTVTVQKGTIAQEVTATGNLVASNKQSLSFETAGTVAEVLVAEGQAVEKGQVLAKLDTGPLEDQITSLERQLTRAQRQQTAAERQVAAAKDKVVAAERQVTAKARQQDNAEYQVTVAERQVATAERQVTLAERKVTDAEKKVNDAGEQVTTAEDGVTTAERQVAARERDVTQAEINLTSAQNDLQKALDAYNVSGRRDLIAARTATLRKAEAYLEYAQKQLDLATDENDAQNKSIWTNEVAFARQEVAEAAARVDELISTGESADISTKRKQIDLVQSRLDDAKYNVDDARKSVEKAKAAVEKAKAAVADAKTGVADAKQAVADAKNGVTDANRALANARLTFDDAKIAVGDAEKAMADAQTDVTDAKTAVEDAGTAVADAQKALDDAKATGTLITAPFAGYITKVSITDGSTVQKGATVIEMLDPTRFEVNILVSEQDIYSIKAEGEASVQLEAMSALSIPATVTRIAPTATIQQGVVSYSVKVDLDLAQLQAGRMAGQGQTGQAQVGQGQFIPRQGQAGQLTPDQVRERMSRAQGQMPSSGATQSGAMMVLPLKEGLSATVTITILKKDNVLLVPSRAITRKSGQSTVQVLNNGVTETRVVKTGLSDFSNIEITEGLNEGEQVVMPQVTGTTTQTQQGQNRMIIPGGGMFR